RGPKQRVRHAAHRRNHDDRPGVLVRADDAGHALERGSVLDGSAAEFQYGGRCHLRCGTSRHVRPSCDSTRGMLPLTHPTLGLRSLRLEPKETANGGGTPAFGGPADRQRRDGSDGTGGMRAYEVHHLTKPRQGCQVGVLTGFEAYDSLVSG